VLTTYDGDEDIHRALEAGAQAYLLKAMSHSDLANAIRTVHAGSKYIPESISKSLASRPPRSNLSGRELQVLELIVKGRSNKEIGDALGISEATVKWHINVILSRLDVTDRTQATVTALQRGIVHLP
jgi:two-component system NarL family response regulator